MSDMRISSAGSLAARRAWNDLPDLLSLLVFFGVTAFLFRSWEFALVVTASLGFHELGHAAALTWYHLNFRIHFGMVGAWTWSPLQDRMQLSQLSNAIIHLAGPLFSILLAIFALCLQTIWRPSDQHLWTLASFSAQVGLLNLLPLGPLSDGGKIVRRMIGSLEQAQRALAVLLPMLVTVLLFLLYALLELPHFTGSNPGLFWLGLLLIGLWMASCLMVEASRPAVVDEERPFPMTSGQVYSLILVMWGFLVLGFIITAATPFWLEPQYLIGSLQNIAAFLHVASRIKL